MTWMNTTDFTTTARRVTFDAGTLEEEEERSSRGHAKRKASKERRRRRREQRMAKQEEEAAANLREMKKALGYFKDKQHHNTIVSIYGGSDRAVQRAITGLLDASGIKKDGSIADRLALFRYRDPNYEELVESDDGPQAEAFLFCLSKAKSNFMGCFLFISDSPTASQGSVPSHQAAPNTFSFNYDDSNSEGSFGGREENRRPVENERDNDAEEGEKQSFKTQKRERDDGSDETNSFLPPLSTISIPTSPPADALRKTVIVTQHRGVSDKARSAKRRKVSKKPQHQFC